MNSQPVPGRREIVAILARFADHRSDEVDESIDSMELVRLIYEVEQGWGVTLDLSDDEIARMSTLSGAVAVLGRAMAKTS